MNLVQVGPLAAILTPDIAAQAVTQDVVLLHGFGAPGTDLVGLAAQLSAPPVPQGTRFVFLQAPHTLEEMAGPHAGRAWWHIDMMALHVARLTGEHETLAASIPEGLTEAREALDAAFTALQADHGLVPERTYLGGFSQGAMLSCDWTLRLGRPLLGLIQLSGTVICEPEWRAALPRRKGLRVFQSHSPDDPVLPYELATRLGSHFREAGLVHEFVSFRGGHGIGPSVLERLGQFLSAPTA